MSQKLTQKIKICIIEVKASERHVSTVQAYRRVWLQRADFVKKVKITELSQDSVRQAFSRLASKGLLERFSRGFIMFLQILLLENLG